MSSLETSSGYTQLGSENRSSVVNKTSHLGTPTDINQEVLFLEKLSMSNNTNFSLVIDEDMEEQDFSFLPPGFEKMDESVGCSCWATHGDSKKQEMECRCQGEHVVQLPANLSADVDRLTLTKMGLESLGQRNLSHYSSSLSELILRDVKRLRIINDDCFINMTHLRTIYISHAPLLKTLPPQVFQVHLPKLKVLRMVHTGLVELPNLTHLNTNSIIHMVDLENNRIRRIRSHSINISAVQFLLDNNMLQAVEAEAFQGSEIAKLSMKGNKGLTDLHPLAFKGLKSLVSLDLSETGISQLPTVGLEGLESLRLVGATSLKVFPSVYSFKSITRAELTYHHHCCAFRFPRLHHPEEHKKHQEYRRMVEKHCGGGGDVTSPPALAAAAQVGLARRRVAYTTTPAPLHEPPALDPDADYQYVEHNEHYSNNGFGEIETSGLPDHHGSDIDEEIRSHDSNPVGRGSETFSEQDGIRLSEKYYPLPCVNGLCPNTNRFSQDGINYTFIPRHPFNVSNDFGSGEAGGSQRPLEPETTGRSHPNNGSASVVEVPVGHTHKGQETFHPEVIVNAEVRIVCEGNLSNKNYRDVQCVPEPDAFNPCEDIMGNLGLRVAVWVVVVTAVFGNLAVMVVLMSTRFTMTVSKFLMCNLAVADLCMGLYLLIIAAMDLHTIGVYFNYAITWQNGPGCKVAGFLTVFASELSILTLTVITLERWYAITYAIHLNKRLRLPVALKVMVLAWLYALTMATLPLLGVSGYSKTSICLPMEAMDGGDQAYLLILLITNGLAFILICVCYAKMYCSIAGNNLAANTSDTTVAKRMALLVFTDFACWAPIAFFGLTAVSGYPLISVTHAKFLLVFFYPLNSCANPYLYAILTKQYRRDLFILLARHGFCTKRAMKYKGGYSTNTLLNLHNVCVSGGTGGGSGGPSRRISTLTQITTCGDWRSRVRDGSEESLGRQCSPSRPRSISAELTVSAPMTIGLTDRRLSDVGRRLQPVAEARDGRAPNKLCSLAPNSGSPHPIKNCYARMSFTPEQEALLLSYASDKQTNNSWQNTGRADGGEVLPMSSYTPTTPDTISTPISPQRDHSV